MELRQKIADCVVPNEDQPANKTEHSEIMIPGVFGNLEKEMIDTLLRR